MRAHILQILDYIKSNFLTCRVHFLIWQNVCIHVWHEYRRFVIIVRELKNYFFIFLLMFRGGGLEGFGNLASSLMIVNILYIYSTTTKKFMEITKIFLYCLYFEKILTSYGTVSENWVTHNNYIILLPEVLYLQPTDIKLFDSLLHPNSFHISVN